MKILDNTSAMTILFDIGMYAEEEREKLMLLRGVIRRQQIVSFRLLKLVQNIDEMFMHMWEVECLRQQAFKIGLKASSKLNAAVDDHVHKAMRRIDLYFTEASHIAGIA